MTIQVVIHYIGFYLIKKKWDMAFLKMNVKQMG